MAVCGGLGTLYGTMQAYATNPAIDAALAASRPALLLTGATLSCPTTPNPIAFRSAVIAYVDDLLVITQAGLTLNPVANQYVAGVKTYLDSIM